MSSLSTCHMELVALDDQLVKSSKKKKNLLNLVQNYPSGPLLTIRHYIPYTGTGSK